MPAFTNENEWEHNVDLQPLTLFSLNETLQPPARAKEQLQASCQVGHLAQCVEPRLLPTERMLSPRPSPSPRLTQLLREEEEKEGAGREWHKCFPHTYPA